MSKFVNMTEDLYAYVLGVTVRQNPVLEALREETAAMPWGGMQIAADQGAFMAMLLKLMGARRVLEIGVFTGYSSLIAALALPEDGQIVACDISKEYTSIARRYWEQVGVDHKIDLRIGRAEDTLDALIKDGMEWFDFAFIDADKDQVDVYYEACLQLVRHGGLIAIDNAFMDGAVLHNTTDPEVSAMRAVNAKISDDPRVDVSMVPIGDGVLLARRR